MSGCPTHDLHGTAEDYDWLVSWHIYYCYAPDGTLLYVGQSKEPEQRMSWHRYSGSAWYPYCSRVEISPEIRCGFEASKTEIREIRRLGPAFNNHYNIAPRPWAVPDAPHLKWDESPELVWLDSLPAERAS